MPTTTAAYSALQAIRVRKAQIETELPETAAATPDLTEGVQPAETPALDNDLQGKTEGGQYQDADAAQAADPVNKRKTTMSQMDQSAQVDNPSQGGSGGSPMESMPGQQGGKDALAASNKTSAEGAAAVAQIEAMAGPGPQARPAFQQSNNPYSASQMPGARGVPQSNLFQRKFRRF